jgi:transcriptional regulator with XRE-family HTH domain
MVAVGESEREAEQVGAKIFELRNARGWTRAKLVSRVMWLMDDEGLNCDHINEGWMERLENRRVTKVPSRKMLEVLCRALDCTPREWASVMLHANRTLLGASTGPPNKVAEVLNYITSRLYDEAREILEGRIGAREVGDLTEEDMFELVTTALEMVSRHHRRR